MVGFLPFHRGEREAQERAGGGARIAAIRDFMPDQHREFFAGLRYLFAATIDETGQPFATALTGEPGFIASPDERTLAIAALLDANDPATATFAAGASIGLLGIDLETRRRNRANGVIRAIGLEGFAVDVQESFGNCPQYIQTRSVRRASVSDGPAEAFAALSNDHRAIIASADTFFIATSGGASGGLDMSHRGGQPGFVKVEGDVLTIPDFRGNRYFNTFGNLMIEPRAALLFVDFERGDVLHLQGETEIDWSGDDADRPIGAERILRFHIRRGWLRRAALPLRWTFGDYAPTTLRTGDWTQRAA